MDLDNSVFLLASQVMVGMSESWLLWIIHDNAIFVEPLTHLRTSLYSFDASFI
jgi:hypothetical protein